MIAVDALTYKPYKALADKEMKLIAEEDGMGAFRRQYTYLAVRLFGRAKDKYRL
jgi:hypothetical protein